jgi:hypothetical protein
MNAKNQFIKHAAICFGVFFIITLISVFSPKVHLGFFGNISLLLSGTFFTTIGVALGDLFRRIARPDLFLSSGAMETFKTKIFWTIGPQVIGWIMGYICTSGFMGNVLGYKGFV